LPLFAAAEAREDTFRPEATEPAVTLAAMSAGREVVEDYRSLQLSLRAHPLSFLRDELASRKMVRCADLPNIPDGRRVEVAGIILVRQKPGSAKGVLFITIEDENRNNLILDLERPIGASGVAVVARYSVFTNELSPNADTHFLRQVIYLGLTYRLGPR